MSNSSCWCIQRFPVVLQSNAWQLLHIQLRLERLSKHAMEVLQSRTTLRYVLHNYGSRNAERIGKVPVLVRSQVLKTWSRHGTIPYRHGRLLSPTDSPTFWGGNNVDYSMLKVTSLQWIDVKHWCNIVRYLRRRWNLYVIIIFPHVFVNGQHVIYFVLCVDLYANSHVGAYTLKHKRFASLLHRLLIKQR